eukprot:3119665-Pleurochrysis_carterae.AAC.1
MQPSLARECIAVAEDHTLKKQTDLLGCTSPWRRTPCPWEGEEMEERRAERRSSTEEYQQAHCRE